MQPSPSISVDLPKDDQELSDFLSVVSQALFFPGADWDVWLQREGAENVRVAHKNGEVAGGLILQRMGQWFGGVSVPMVAIRVVGVAAQHRAGGVGTVLMQEAIKEIHRDGVPLSILYPATQPVYRRQGYEMAGMRLCYQMGMKSIDVRDRTLDVRPIEKNDHALLREIYSERARRTAGNLDRNDWYWQRILDPPSWQSPVTGYLFLRGSKPEGYVIFSQNSGASFDDHAIAVSDLVLLTADAGRRFLSFMADHRSMAHNVSWCGPLADPMLYLLAEQNINVTESFSWMLRVVDVPGALTARKYPSGLNTELHLEVSDELLSENNGRFVLEVSESRGRVKEGGRGDLQISIQGLAPLYTGHLSAIELQATGMLSGDEKTLSTASSIFSGPAPWMPDIF